MTQSRIHFGAGLFLGILVTAVFFHFFAPRYEVVNSDNVLMKQDKWTGQSWRYEGFKWKQITETIKDWKPVDAALLEALNIHDISDANYLNAHMVRLKKKYPILETFSDEDIMERIKYIYARKIMVELYFNKMETK